MAGHSRSKNGVASVHLCPGHPRLNDIAAENAWMAGTSPAMTKKTHISSAWESLKILTDFRSGSEEKLEVTR
jgi:hypothetical protein